MHQRLITVSAVACLLLILVSGCHMAVNRSVYVDDGETVGHGYNAVNGNITIGDDCSVKGDCRSVNGNIRVGTGSKTGDLQCVNGSITIGAESVIYGSIGSVNGPVDCGSGVIIKKDLDTVNGDVDVTNTRVEHDLTTYNGDITLRNGSIVEGDIEIKEPKGDNNLKSLVIKLEDGSVVKGDVINRARDVRVRLLLGDNCKVTGRIRDVEVIER